MTILESIKCVLQQNNDGLTSKQIYDEIIRQDESKRLYEAISQLTPIQRRRIMMLLEDMDCMQIAKTEGRHPSVIYRSIEKSFLRLRALLQG